MSIGRWSRMQPQQRSSRIDIAELKAQIVKKIGAEKSKRYFFYLNRFLSQKLGKSEFDKFCSRVLGRDGLPLHNLFILSILKNACDAQTSPPSVNEAGPAKSATRDGREQNDSHGGTCAPNATIRSNGAGLQMSPKNGRSRKLKDQPSPIGPNQKGNYPLHSKFTEDSGSKVTVKNGDFITPFDYQRPTKYLQGLAEQPENQREASVQRSFVRPSQVSSFRKDQIDGSAVDNGEHVGQENHLNMSRTSLIAPLGIPFCSASVGGGGRKDFPVAIRSNYVSYCDCGGLYDTDTLKNRMEQMAAVQGLGGVSLECATVMNGMVDVYLKQLIKSCVELVRARSGHEPIKQPSHVQDIQHKLVNGMRSSNYLHMQSSSGPVQNSQEQKTSCSISLLDFKVAMELNPQQLGEDWPLLLEKICMNAFAD